MWDLKKIQLFSEKLFVRNAIKSESYGIQMSFRGAEGAANFFDPLSTRYFWNFFQPYGGQLQDFGLQGGVGLQGHRRKVVVSHPGLNGPKSLKMPLKEYRPLVNIFRKIFIKFDNG